MLEFSKTAVHKDTVRLLTNLLKNIKGDERPSFRIRMLAFRELACSN